MYVCTNTHTHTHTNIPVRSQADEPKCGTRARTSGLRRVCIHVYMHTYTHTYIPTCIHACIHTYIHKYVHTYVHTYVRTYTHTDIHTYINACKHLPVKSQADEPKWGTRARTPGLRRGMPATPCTSTLYRICAAIDLSDRSGGCEYTDTHAHTNTRTCTRT